MGRVVSTLLGYEIPGTTITRYCASSVQTSRMAFHAIKAGEGDAFISAGVETVSRFAHGSSDNIPGTRNPRFDEAGRRTEVQAQGGQDWHDPDEDGKMPDIYIAMGQTAENLARMRGLHRRDLDEFAVRSQNLAEKAINDGFWANEITPVTTPDGSEVTADDGPRAGVTYEAISTLAPVFRPDGVVTAGNCCALNDGAAAVIIMSDAKAKELGLTPLARIVSTGVTGLSPEIMGLGPVEATREALMHANMSINDIDLVEINEAFAAQVVPSYQDLGIDIDRLNVNGGSIAVGHPFGMTGARLQNTMLNSLNWHDKSTGLITMCVGGGQGMAMILERVS
jgi:acetyl-CoA C-acetyltransferase